MASTLPQPHPTPHLGSSHAESIVINIYIKVDINVEMEESSYTQQKVSQVQAAASERGSWILNRMWSCSIRGSLYILPSNRLNSLLICVDDYLGERRVVRGRLLALIYPIIPIPPPYSSLSLSTRYVLIRRMTHTRSGCQTSLRP